MKLSFRIYISCLVTLALVSDFAKAQETVTRTFSIKTATYVKGDDADVEGSNLEVKNTPSDFLLSRKTYIMFNIPKFSFISSAVLELYITDTNGDVALSVHKTSVNWDTSMTWSGAPTLNNLINTVDISAWDEYYNIYVNAAVDTVAGDISFGIYDETAANVKVVIAGGNHSNDPKLTITGILSTEPYVDPIDPVDPDDPVDPEFVIKNDAIRLKGDVLTVEGGDNDELGGLRLGTTGPTIYGRNGRVGIGTSNPGEYTLAVNGPIRVKEVVVESGWSDFVFDDGYKLPSIDEVEDFISTHGHLPDIPSADDVAKEGIGIGQFQSKQLQKIEELTLYIIAQHRNIAKLQENYDELLKRIEIIEVDK